MFDSYNFTIIDLITPATSPMMKAVYDKRGNYIEILEYNDFLNREYEEPSQ